MQQPSSDLFNLIKSLNKAEKRHFKLAVAQQSSTSNYIKLFDAIDKQATYNENKIKRKFKNQPFARKLAATKYLLYDTILKTLRCLYDSRTVDTQLNALLESVELLYQKNLYEQGQKVLNKTKKLAEKYNKTFYQYEVLQWQKRLLPYQSPKKFTMALEALWAADSMLTQYLYNESKFSELVHRVKWNHLNSNENKTIAAVLAHPLMESEARALTFMSRIHYYEVLYHAHQQSGDYPKAFDALQHIIALWEQHEAQIPAYIHQYWQHLADYLRCGFNAKVNFDHPVIFRRLQQLLNFAPIAAPKHALMMAILEFMVFLSTDNLAGCSQKITNLVHLLESQHKTISVMWQITAYYYISIYYFLMANYQIALEMLHKMDDFAKLGLCPSIQDFCQLLELLIHYELEHYKHLEYRLRAVYRNLKNKRIIGGVERLILKYIRKLVFVDDPSKTSTVFKQFYQLLSNAKMTPKNLPPLGNSVIQDWAYARC